MGINDIRQAEGIQYSNASLKPDCTKRPGGSEGRKGGAAEQPLGDCMQLQASDGSENQWVANSHILDNLPKAKVKCQSEKKKKHLLYLCHVVLASCSGTALWDEIRCFPLPVRFKFY